MRKVTHFKKTIIIFISLLLIGCNSNVTTENPYVCTPGSKDCKSIELSYDDLIISDTFINKTIRELINSIENKETFIAYIGFKTCPWCKDALPCIKEQADAFNLKIYYINVRPDGDTKEFDLRIDTNKDYVQLQEIFKDIMQDDTNKIYVPVVICVEDGKITSYHYGTLDEHDATKRKMTKEEIDILNNLYKEMFENFKK